MTPGWLGPIPADVRRRACRVLHHEDPTAFGLGGCVVPDEELVHQLCDRVEQLENRLARETQESR